MQTPAFMPVGSRTFKIKLDSYADGAVTGRLRHCRYPREIPFTGVIRLAMIVEEILDTEDCPGPVETGLDFLPAEEERGAALAELTLDVMFRENYSWQGRVVREDTRRETAFRSVLELLVLLEENFGE